MLGFTLNQQVSNQCQTSGQLPIRSGLKVGYADFGACQLRLGKVGNSFEEKS